MLDSALVMGQLWMCVQTGEQDNGDQYCGKGSGGLGQWQVEYEDFLGNHFLYIFLHCSRHLLCSLPSSWGSRHKQGDTVTCQSKWVLQILRVLNFGSYWETGCGGEICGLEVEKATGILNCCDCRQRKVVRSSLESCPTYSHSPLLFLSLMGSVNCPRIKIPGGNCRKNFLDPQIINALQRWGSCGDCNWFRYTSTFQRVCNAVGDWANCATWPSKIAGSFQGYSSPWQWCLHGTSRPKMSNTHFWMGEKKASSKIDHT